MDWSCLLYRQSAQSTPSKALRRSPAMKINRMEPGFSLVELMVTVALVAIILSFSSAYINSSPYRLRAAAYQLRSVLQKARLEAIKLNRPVFLDFDFNRDTKLTKSFTTRVAATEQSLDYTESMSGIAFGRTPVDKSGPAEDDLPYDNQMTGSSITPGNGICISDNRARFRFNPDGMASTPSNNACIATGTVYLHIVASPNAGTYGIVLSSTGRTRIFYFQSGGPRGSWKAQ
jgi:prepilin-type N-terminal cleavage/methylation domain-containing protein